MKRSIKSLRPALAFLALLCTVACAAFHAANVTPLTAFPLVVGQQSVLVNQDTGAVTTFTVGPPQDFGCFGQSYPVTFHKSERNTYPQPDNGEDVTLWLKRTEDGRLITTAVVTKQWGNGAESTAQTYGTAPSYAAILPNFAVGQVYAVPNSFLNRSGLFAPCLDPAAQPSGTPGFFATYLGVQNVDTPAYRGPAVTYRYAEGDGVPRPWDGNGENNAEQYFWANGLVEHINHHYHYQGWDWDTGCHIWDRIEHTKDGDITRVSDPYELAGVDWVACTVPNSKFKTERIPHMVLKAVKL